MDSILTSIKQLLGGISETETHFDPEIIMDINTAFSMLTQMGAGPITGFSISDKTSVWTDFIPDMSKVEMIKSYVHLKVKLLFDPPSSSTIIEVINREITQLEWRINVAVDSGGEVV